MESIPKFEGRLQTKWERQRDVFHSCHPDRKDIPFLIPDGESSHLDAGSEGVTEMQGFIHELHAQCSSYEHVAVMYQERQGGHQHN